MSIRLDDLLKQVPHNTRDRVDRVRKQMGSILRDAIRQETGLLLQRRPEEAPGVKQVAEGVSVPVQLKPGYPECLRHVVFPDEYWPIFILCRYQRALRATSNAAEPLQQMCGELRRLSHGDQLVRDRDKHIPPVKELVDELLMRLEQADPLKRILEVNEDILGAYRYRVSRDLLHADPMHGEIELYWAVIGLVADLMDVGVEDLSVIVLAHELGHAYSHLGADIDGLRWDSDGFAASDTPLKEGLAQYYAYRVLQRTGMQYAHSREVFTALAQKQPAAYRSHEQWVTDFKPEEVRFAMIESRRRGEAKLVDFQAGLTTAKKQLRIREEVDESVRTAKTGREGVAT